MSPTIIPLSRPSFGPEETNAVADVLDTAWVSQGPTVAEFERSFAETVNARHAVATSSCTSALHLSLLALDIRPGDEVLLPSLTFIATANAVRMAGGTAVFVDIDLATYNSSPEHYAAAITPKTRAILCVHQIGLPCDLAGLREITQGKDIAIIEDAACALGSEIQTGGTWQRIGAPHGDVACFSLHGRKILSTGEGGMITTGSQDIAARIRSLRHHGMSVSDVERARSSEVVYEEYREIGYNYRLSDVQAAIGLAQLRKLDAFVKERRELANAYAERLGEATMIEAPHEPTWARANWQSYCVRLPSAVDQRTVLAALRKMGIGAKRGIACIHREIAYAERPEGWRKSQSLSQSEAAQDQTILLPMYNGLSLEQIDQVVDALSKALDSAGTS